MISELLESLTAPACHHDGHRAARELAHDTTNGPTPHFSYADPRPSQYTPVPTTPRS
jgi:hypothetical protein